MAITNGCSNLVDLTHAGQAAITGIVDKDAIAALLQGANLIRAGHLRVGDVRGVEHRFDRRRHIEEDGLPGSDHAIQGAQVPDPLRISIAMLQGTRGSKQWRQRRQCEQRESGREGAPAPGVRRGDATLLKPEPEFRLNQKHRRRREHHIRRQLLAMTENSAYGTATHISIARRAGGAAPNMTLPNAKPSGM